ncbi:DMSO/selenate family reductase complex A subunit [uncultured Adlercreutzia sp.]|uniref:DMSO/selenate family reductase complex A subunit n=1 Tax=uncultured Adlercreutzia sp. TaxID=875803 RepID=UPI0025F4AD15|nr:DMSO/selenate family reductase complex A subunit [uncultured Adlercreutzia sp.]MCI9261107.1 molybdopterin-dependent oxidoreductase [Eggerthellaceae bacterium]
MVAQAKKSISVQPEALVDSERRVADGTRTVFGYCSVNCEGRCVLNFHLKGDELLWVETDRSVEDGADARQIRACLRGRSIREWINHADRLSYPLKRVGRRGEGAFKRVSWDEALDEIAANLKRVVETYGNEAVYINFASGVMSANIMGFLHRFMNLYGGCLEGYGDYSHSQIDAALPYLYGARDANTPTDVKNAKLLVLFGDNTFETKMCGAGGSVHLKDAILEAGVRTIVVDPRYSETAANCADEWIALRPGTDGALAAALAYVMIEEDLIDHEFLEHYCIGFDEDTLPASAPTGSSYRSYILGLGADGVAKTPQWAAAITGVPAASIVKLAREMAAAKPCAIYQGKGPQRHANGEQTARAIAMLAVLTGNVGLAGGGTGSDFETFRFFEADVPGPDNPVTTAIPVFLWTDAVARGPQMTASEDGVVGTDRLKTGIKFIWNYAGNTLINQHSNINRTHDILADESKCEFVVVIDTFLTSSARYADIVLPDLLPVEQPSLIANDWAGDSGYVLMNSQYLPQRGERRTLYWMLSQLAERLEFAEAFTEGRSEEEWRQVIYEQAREADPELPPYEVLLEQGLYRRSNPDGCHVAFREFREDPEGHPLATPSGKIEIYSEKILQDTAHFTLLEGEVISPLPVYAAPFFEEGAGDSERYPLQLIGFHHRSRAHSSYGSLDAIKERARHQLWINPLDAAPRGVCPNEMVEVITAYGRVMVEAKVTERIMPGVIALGEGAWHRADMEGDRVDWGGCINTLTSSRATPLAKGNPQHSNRAQVKKAG